MPLTIKDVLSYTWPLHMGFQESSQYVHLAGGMSGMG